MPSSPASTTNQFTPAASHHTGPGVFCIVPLQPPLRDRLEWGFLPFWRGVCRLQPPAGGPVFRRLTARLTYCGCMALLDYPKFTWHFGVKIVFVWTLVAWVYTEVTEQPFTEALLDPPDWAWVTLIAMALTWVNYNY